LFRESFHESGKSGPSQDGRIAGGSRSGAIRILQVQAGTSWTYEKLFFLHKNYTWKEILQTSIMATFTRIEEKETPSITIHPSHKIAKINDNIYGGFTE
jgi:hypothetical protein